MPRSCLLIAVLLLAAPVRAQHGTSQFVGVVLDADDGRPLPGAHVILAGTMVGTAAGPRGRFELRDVPPGSHRLYATMVGYGAAALDTLVTGGRAYVVTLRLEPEVTTLPGVRVEAERDRRWHRHHRRFVRMFVGEVDFADETELLNPEVLSYDGGWGRLTARADSALVIANRALGYRLRYYLEAFERRGGLIRYDGEPLFEPLVAADSVQAAQWRANRRRAYRGSLRHLLRALIRGRTREEGFALYRTSDLGGRTSRWRVEPEDLIHADSTGAWLLGFDGLIEVIYTREPESRAYALRHRPGVPQPHAVQRSWMRLSSGPTLIDRHGEPLDPYGITVSGYFAFESVAATMLPKEYEPDASPSD